MLQDKLEFSIRDLMEIRGACGYIIAHPSTVEDLIKEVEGQSTIKIINHSDLRYRGVKILRSVDVNEGIFIVA